MPKFTAVLFATDGERVTDFERDTIEEVNNAINDMGSRWIFYPICCVAELNQTDGRNSLSHKLVSIPLELKVFGIETGMTIREVSRCIESLQAEIEEFLQ